MPRVEDLVELNQLLREFIHVLTTFVAWISYNRAFGLGSFNLVSKTFEGTLEFRIEERFWLVWILLQLEHGAGCLNTCVDEHCVWVGGKCVVLNCHSDQKEAEFFNFRQVSLLCFFVLLRNDSLLDQWHICLEDVVWGYKIKLELEELQEFLLSLQDALLGEGVVWDLLRDDTGVERVDVLVFWGEVHCSNSNSVYIWIFHDFDTLLGSEVLIEECNGEEIGANSTLEGCSNLNHPVDHLSPVLLANLVFAERGHLEFISGYQVLMYLLEQGELEVFTFIWGRMFCAYKALTSLCWVYWASSDFCNPYSLPIWRILFFHAIAIRVLPRDGSISWDAIYLVHFALSALFCCDVLCSLSR